MKINKVNKSAVETSNRILSPVNIKNKVIELNQNKLIEKSKHNSHDLEDSYELKVEDTPHTQRFIQSYKEYDPCKTIVRPRKRRQTTSGLEETPKFGKEEIKSKSNISRQERLSIPVYNHKTPNIKNFYLLNEISKTESLLPISTRTNANSINNNSYSKSNIDSNREKINIINPAKDHQTSRDIIRKENDPNSLKKNNLNLSKQDDEILKPFKIQTHSNFHSNLNIKDKFENEKISPKYNRLGTKYLTNDDDKCAANYNLINSHSIDGKKLQKINNNPELVGCFKSNSVDKEKLDHFHNDTGKVDLSDTYFLTIKKFSFNKFYCKKYKDHNKSIKLNDDENEYLDPKEKAEKSSKLSSLKHLTSVRKMESEFDLKKSNQFLSPKNYEIKHNEFSISNENIKKPNQFTLERNSLNILNNYDLDAKELKKKNNLKQKIIRYNDDLEHLSLIPKDEKEYIHINRKKRNSNKKKDNNESVFVPNINNITTNDGNYIEGANHNIEYNEGISFKKTSHNDVVENSEKSNYESNIQENFSSSLKQNSDFRNDSDINKIEEDNQIQFKKPELKSKKISRIISDSHNEENVVGQELHKKLKSYRVPKNFNKDENDSDNQINNHTDEKKSQNDEADNNTNSKLNYQKNYDSFVNENNIVNHNIDEKKCLNNETDNNNDINYQIDVEIPKFKKENQFDAKIFHNGENDNINEISNHFQEKIDIKDDNVNNITNANHNIYESKVDHVENNIYENKYYIVDNDNIKEERNSIENQKSIKNDITNINTQIDEKINEKGIDDNEVNNKDENKLIEKNNNYNTNVNNDNADDQIMDNIGMNNHIENKNDIKDENKNNNKVNNTDDQKFDKGVDDKNIEEISCVEDKNPKISISIDDENVTDFKNKKYDNSDNADKLEEEYKNYENIPANISEKYDHSSTENKNYTKVENDNKIEVDNPIQYYTFNSGVNNKAEVKNILRETQDNNCDYEKKIEAFKDKNIIEKILNHNTNSILKPEAYEDSGNYVPVKKILYNNLVESNSGISQNSSPLNKIYTKVYSSVSNKLNLEQVLITKSYDKPPFDINNKTVNKNDNIDNLNSLSSRSRLNEIDQDRVDKNFSRPFEKPVHIKNTKKKNNKVQKTNYFGNNNSELRVKEPSQNNDFVEGFDKNIMRNQNNTENNVHLKEIVHQLLEKEELFESNLTRVFNKNTDFGSNLGGKNSDFSKNSKISFVVNASNDNEVSKPHKKNYPESSLLYTANINNLPQNLNQDIKSLRKDAEFEKLIDSNSNSNIGKYTPSHYQISNSMIKGDDNFEYFKVNNQNSSIVNYKPNDDKLSNSLKNKGSFEKLKDNIPKSNIGKSKLSYDQGSKSLKKVDKFEKLEDKNRNRDIGRYTPRNDQISSFRNTENLNYKNPISNLATNFSIGDQISNYTRNTDDFGKKIICKNPNNNLIKYTPIGDQISNSSRKLDDFEKIIGKNATINLSKYIPIGDQISNYFRKTGDFEKLKYNNLNSSIANYSLSDDKKISNYTRKSTDFEKINDKNPNSNIEKNFPIGDQISNYFRKIDNLVKINDSNPDINLGNYPTADRISYYNRKTHDYENDKLPTSSIGKYTTIGDEISNYFRKTDVFEKISDKNSNTNNSIKYFNQSHDNLKTNGEKNTTADEEYTHQKWPNKKDNKIIEINMPLLHHQENTSNEIDGERNKIENLYDEIDNLNKKSDYLHLKENKDKIIDKNTTYKLSTILNNLITNNRKNNNIASINISNSFSPLLINRESNMRKNKITDDCNLTNEILNTKANDITITKPNSSSSSNSNSNLEPKEILKKKLPNQNGDKMKLFFNLDEMKERLVVPGTNFPDNQINFKNFPFITPKIQYVPSTNSFNIHYSKTQLK